MHFGFISVKAFFCQGLLLTFFFRYPMKQRSELLVSLLIAKVMEFLVMSPITQ